MKFFHALLARLLGRNLKSTPKDIIIEQMNESRPLPMGRLDFEEWSDRIISGALMPGGKDDPEIFLDSQKFTLANMLLHLGPTESHKSDAHFVHSLRKFAVNQVADTVCKELRDKAKARLAKEEEIIASGSVEGVNQGPVNEANQG